MPEVPGHYQGASLGIPYLIILGIRSKFDGDLFTAIREEFPWLARDSYLFNACKYLWRLGQKDDIESDATKAIAYLQLWLDSPHPGYPDPTHVEDCLKELKADFGIDG